MGVQSSKSCVTIQGIDEMIASIKIMKTTVARSAMSSAVRAGMATVTRAIRKEVSATPTNTAHEASLKTGMRKLVGSRFKRGGLDKMQRMHATVAKIGFGVGKKSNARMSRGETEGVGVTRSTAHWFVLGTPNRKSHGHVRPLFLDAVPNAVASCGEQAMQAAVAKAKKRFETLAAKRAIKR